MNNPPATHWITRPGLQRAAGGVLQYMTFIVLLITLTGTLFMQGGCANIPPGKIEAIEAESQPAINTRVGNAYLFRGFIGVFSTGMNAMNDELVTRGIRSHIYQADQWASVADAIALEYNNQSKAEPIVLVGHSYGADNILRIAQSVYEQNPKIKIDLIITLDPVTPPTVAPNVRQVVNLYQTNGAWDSLPWLRGIPLEAESPATMLANTNIRETRRDLLDDDLNHFNIEKKPKIHAEVIRQIERICVRRAEWVRLRTPIWTGPDLAAIMHNTLPTTRPTARAQATLLD
jgi:pimeloyl-ACP methyl ester carboxylesterase